MAKILKKKITTRICKNCALCETSGNGIYAVCGQIVWNERDSFPILLDDPGCENFSTKVCGKCDGFCYTGKRSGVCARNHGCRDAWDPGCKEFRYDYIRKIK